MTVERGRIVCSKAGRDKGCLMVAVGTKEKEVLVCNGKTRPLEAPKLKNIKHISAKPWKLTEEQLRTNKSVRHALRDYIVSQQSKER